MGKKVTNADLLKELELQRASIKHLFDRIEKVEKDAEPQCSPSKGETKAENPVNEEYYMRRIVELEEIIRNMNQRFAEDWSQRHPRVVPSYPKDNFPGYPGYPTYPYPQPEPFWYNGPTCGVNQNQSVNRPPRY